MRINIKNPLSLALTIQKYITIVELSKMWLSSGQWNSLLYWDNPRDSGIICGSVLVCLLAVRYISLVRSISIFTSKNNHHLADIFSVIGNLSLALVTATMSFRIYRSVLTAVNKTQDGHPFKVTFIY